MQFQTPYMKNKYKSKPINCDDGITKQCHKEECDINKIINTYDKTGTLINVNSNPPQYGEQPVVDLHTALNIVIEAEKTFNELPSAIRKKFENNPQKFMDFVHNPDNEEKIKEMGLTKVPDKPQEVIVKNEVKLQKEEPIEDS